MEVSQIKLWVSFLKRILVQIGQTNKTNSPILPELTVMLQLLRMTKNKVTGT